jgi:acetyl-CoA/propionyl-CoA carboxylase biotin carboxyl carrier protein
VTAPIRRLFIANRGEIAARITRTATALGIEAIAPPLDGPAALDLLDTDAVVAAAAAARADALHPGYGFLSENAAFAEAVSGAGIRWVGPPASAIRAMGDKAGARHLAASLGVPVVPGYDDADQRDEALVDAAAAIGYPILVKPSGGGGGKGMHRVDTTAALPAALAAARREAIAAFGDGRLILERLVERPRHVEVQVLFDTAANGVHVGERDCSLQRRHQKVLEESPSPAVDAGLRGRMTDAALRLAAAVGYRSAGTVEFLLDDRGAFWFLEMNTRLQVEHPVTEAVTGRDLVADQLRIAAGEPLGFGQGDVRFDGHAIEVRLYAEDADAGFLPATGRVVAARWPTGPGIRIDAGIAVGDEVTGRFDPMLAKLIAHGASRRQALDRLARALEETVVLGLVTNLPFLREIVRHPAVQRGDVRIDTLERDWTPPTRPSPRLGPAARELLGSDAGAWSGGWRLNAPPTVRLEVDGHPATVALDDHPSGPAVVRDGDTVFLDDAGRSRAVRLASPPDVGRAAEAASHAGTSGITSPMPGRVLAVHVADGATVDRGDAIATLEAMKMEHVVTAPSAGRVTGLAVRPGDQLGRGEVLARIEQGAGTL